MNRDEKAAVIDDLASQLKEAEAIFAVDYRGISVPQAAELRAKLREADAVFRIVKNRLTQRAVDAAGTDELKEVLDGPTAFTFVRGDAVLAAKALHQFRREHEILEYKGGVMDGAAVDPEQFGEIARLPGRDVLNGQLAGMVASPLTGVVRGLAALISGLAMQLKQIEEQGLVTGEAPAEEAPAPPAEEAPAEEAPAAEAEPPAEEKPQEDQPQPETTEERPPAEQGEEESQPGDDDTSDDDKED
jgi:large subunit ribosomal protein L10